MNFKLKEIFGQDINLESNIELLHKIGFSVRISCVGVGGMIEDISSIPSILFILSSMY